MQPEELRRASEAVWSRMAPGWDERHAELDRAARPVVERMLERLAPVPDDALLDVAAGTGLVGLAAAPLVGERGRVVLGDFAEPMVRAARRRAAEAGLGNVECRVLDAERLDLPDDAFDGVLCRWGLMLMGDPAAALAECRRVLRPGGALSAAVFSGPEENPWAALPGAVLRAGGHVAPPQPGEPGILALADRGRLADLVRSAGFGEPRIEAVPFELSFPDREAYWGFLTEAAGVVAAVIDGLDDDDRAAVRTAIDDAVAPFAGPGGVRLPAVSLVVSATA